MGSFDFCWCLEEITELEEPPDRQLTLREAAGGGVGGGEEEEKKCLQTLN